MKIINTFKKKITLLFFFINFALYSQNQKFKIFENYRNYGFEVSFVRFNSASTTINQGDYILNNYSDTNFNYSIKRYFKKENEWSYFTGLSYNKTPDLNFDFTFKEEDIQGIDDPYMSYFAPKDVYKYFSTMIGVENKLQLAKNIFFNANFSLNLSYVQNGHESYIIAISDEDEEITREVFGILISTQDNEIQGSAKVSAGVYIPLKFFMLQANICYNKNFQNIFEGVYVFDNLLVSERTKGDYKVSGDYLGISLSIFLKKHKK